MAGTALGALIYGRAEVAWDPPRADLESVFIYVLMVVVLL